MIGRREKKKMIARNKILKAASTIFSEKGFEKASISEIAQKADLGVGTVYNYFKSKDEIFVETFINQVDFDEKHQFDFNKIVENGVADIVIEYVEKFSKIFRYIPKKLMKEFIRVTFGSKNNTALLKNLAELDFKFIDRIEEILLTLKEHNILPDTFDVRVAAEMTYSAYAYEILIYLFTDDYTLEECFERSKVKIRFLF